MVKKIWNKLKLSICLTDCSLTITTRPKLSVPPILCTTWSNNWPKSFIWSNLGHFSVRLFQIFKVNLEVYFTHNYVTEFQFWSSKICWPENHEICLANFEIFPPKFLAGSTRKSPLIIMWAMSCFFYPENLKPKYWKMSEITLYISFLVNCWRSDMSIVGSCWTQ